MAARPLLFSPSRIRSLSHGLGFGPGRGDGGERGSRRKPPLTAAPWSWAVMAAVLGFLAGSLVYAPARWLQEAALVFSQGQLVLTDSQGSVWQGSAQLALSGGGSSRDQVRLPGRVRWTLAPRWDAIRMALRADCCLVQPLMLDFRPSWGGWSVQVLANESSWPMGLLAGLGTPWNTLQLQGRVLVSTSGVRLASTLQRTRFDGALRIQALQVSSRLSTLRPLGSYQLELQGGDVPQLVLSTLQGSLQLSGQGTWSSARLHFDGEASAAAGFDGELSNLLNIIGRRSGARSHITLG